MRMLRRRSCPRRWSRVLLLLGLLALLKVPVYAQVGGANVGGGVADASGAALPGVTITIANTANGRMQSLVTSGKGRYRAGALQPGPYEIVAELTGFGTVRRTVVLVVGADATVDLALGIANLAETITVAEEAPLIELTGANRLEVFLEAFNLTNFINKTGGNGDIRLASFFLPTSALDARHVQWGARFSF